MGQTIGHEKPVEETIRLRDEVVVRVEREPVDAETGAAATDLRKVIEHVRSPVISKQAQVVEKLTIQKDLKEGDETIRDTVKRADVQVEQEGTEKAHPSKKIT